MWHAIWGILLLRHLLICSKCDLQAFGESYFFFFKLMVAFIVLFVEGLSRWSVTDVSIVPESQHPLQCSKGKKAPEVCLFFCPVEHRGSCGISLFGPQWLHPHAAALLSPIHLQSVDYFGYKVSARPVSGCCCIDTSRLKSFEGDKPGGRKKANR